MSLSSSPMACSCSCLRGDSPTPDAPCRSIPIGRCSRWAQPRKGLTEQTYVDAVGNKLTSDIGWAHHMMYGAQQGRLNRKRAISTPLLLLRKKPRDNNGP